MPPSVNISQYTPPLLIGGFRGDDYDWDKQTESYGEIHVWTTGILKHLNSTNIPSDPKEWIVLDAKGEPTQRVSSKFPTAYTYLPVHLKQQRRYSVRFWDLKMLEQGIESEGGVWVGRIKGVAPISELLTAAAKIIPDEIVENVLQGIHPHRLDHKMHAINVYQTWANQDKNVWQEFYEPQVYYRPVEAGGRCSYANCGLCLPLEKAKQKKMMATNTTTENADDDDSS